MSITDQTRPINGHPQPVKLDKATVITTGAEQQDQPASRPGLVRRSTRTAHAAATHERTTALGRFLVRHPSFVVAGGLVASRRAWDGRTAARYERMIRAAEAIGNIEVAQEWEMRGASFRAARHRRRMDMLLAPIHLARAAAVATALGTTTLLVAGIVMAIAEHHISDVLTPITGAIDTIAWACALISLLWGPTFAAAPFLAVAALWAVGRKHGNAPAWMLPGGKLSNEGAPITPSIVVTALRDLGIAPLRNAIKDMGDAGAAMLSPIVIAGCGVEVDAMLPSGVSTEEVLGRRRKLAENLGRHEHEVFVTVAQAARTVNLWIADSGALDEPIGPSPLTFDTSVSGDYKNGRAPWGQDLRGDATSLSLYQRHLLATGLSNQGKTASLRALALWLVLDPTVEFRIGDLKGVGDWNMFSGLATVLIEGPRDEEVIAVTEMLEEGVREMERRILAPAGSKFPPLVLLVDEAQVAFMCPAIGDDKRPYGGTKATSRYFMAARKIHNQGRAVNVTLWQGTQDPTDQNLPKLVREGAHIRASLVLGTEAQARMALGDKAIDGGAAPHKLRQDIDKGTLVVSGSGMQLPPGQSSLTIRTHFIDDDQAATIAERAKAVRAGVTTRTAVEPPEKVDALADIATVIGGEPKVGTDEVRQRLAVLNPAVYRGWTASDLKQALDAVGAGPYKSVGVMVVSRDRVLEALAERDTQQVVDGGYDDFDEEL